MAIVRWEPFRDLLTTQDRFNRLFNETFSNVFGNEQVAPQAWTPAVDVYEDEKGLVIKADLAGVDPKEVDIRVEDGTLYLKGERKSEHVEKGKNVHRIERSYGSFMRTFALPRAINTDGIKADYKDGVLTLTLAKREEAKPKTIKVNVSNGAEAASARK
ncbi:MAG: Hsp20/alpha crystallin family protein [Terriglobia bacterium]